MSVRQGNKIIASKPTIDNSVTQDSPNAVSGGAVYSALQTKQNVLISGTNIKTINSNSLLGSGDLTIDSLPSQTGNSGKYLTTDGSSASWAAVNTLPSQTGNAGKFLTTDGTDASWSDTINPFNVKMQNINYSAGIIFKGVGNTRDIFQINMQPSTGIVEFDIRKNNNTRTGYYYFDSAISPALSGYTLGKTTNKWTNVYTEKINNGSDITVPNTAGTMIVADNTGATQGQVLTLDSNLDAQWASSSDANTDLSNLTSTGANIGNWSSNVTNCITEIPQDIKLELSSGTLTLKAGSKVYVPNGFDNDNNPVFDEVSIDTDKQFTTTVTNSTLLVCYAPSMSGIYIRPVENCKSGPGATTTDGYAYDTTTNIISYYVNSGIVLFSGCSLPIAIVSADSGGFANIDQVFNGFGYIGSTVFALPGVKGLIPNGRNADGSLNNINMNITSVQTLQTVYADHTNWVGHLVGQNGNIGQVAQDHYFEQPNEPNGITDWTVWFNTNDNMVYLRNIGSGDSDDKWVVAQDLAAFHWVVDSNAKITSFNPKTVFHAVDYSDSEYITNCAMPSDKYIDLTLGATGASYVALADGYIYVNIQQSNNPDVSVVIGNNNESSNNYGVRNNITGKNYVFVPVRKGATFFVNYNTGTKNAFRLYYANGTI